MVQALDQDSIRSSPLNKKCETDPLRAPCTEQETVDCLAHLATHHIDWLQRALQALDGEQRERMAMFLLEKPSPTAVVVATSEFGTESTCTGWGKSSVELEDVGSVSGGEDEDLEFPDLSPSIKSSMSSCTRDFLLKKRSTFWRPQKSSTYLCLEEIAEKSAILAVADEVKDSPKLLRCNSPEPADVPECGACVRCEVDAYGLVEVDNGPLPTIYVDDRTILQEITDVTLLRKGDHCLSPLNMVRTLSSVIDYIHSLMGSLHLIRIFHHFVVLEDVAYVDEQGIPRDSSGKMVEILEYSNTVPGFWEDLKHVGFIENILKKAKCRRVPLADYGDMPFIHRVVERISEGKRVEIVSKAYLLERHHPVYNVMMCNCEHTTNQICNSGEFYSPQVPYVLWNLTRFILHGIGVFFLWTGSTFMFHLLTTIPVLIQAMTHLSRTLAAIKAQTTENLISTQTSGQMIRLQVWRMVAAVVGCTVIFGSLPYVLLDDTLDHLFWFHVACIVVCNVYWMVDAVFHVTTLAAQKVYRGLGHSRVDVLAKRD